MTVPTAPPHKQGSGTPWASLVHPSAMLVFNRRMGQRAITYRVMMPVGPRAETTPAQAVAGVLVKVSMTSALLHRAFIL